MHFGAGQQQPYGGKIAAMRQQQLAVGGYTDDAQEQFDFDLKNLQQLIQPTGVHQAILTRNNPLPIEDALEEKYEAVNVVGADVFGTVYKARDRKTNREVAIKKLRVEEESHQGSDVPAQVIREIACLRDFVHPNVVQLLDIHFAGVQDYSLVYECVHGDLDMLLKSYRQRSEKMPMDLVKRYTSELLNGIYACHVRLILHRDLKPRKILIGQDGLKIGDFGLARTLSTPLREVTLWYRAPEILLGCTHYGPEVDMWSAGSIIAEMATGNAIFPGDSAIGTIFKIFQVCGTPSESTWPGLASMQHWKPHFPQWPPTEFQSIKDARDGLDEQDMGLIRGLLSLNPQQRLSARRAKNSPFVQNILRQSQT
jgi:serine/threonine protein kinase